jgi:hypothetical protein
MRILVVPGIRSQGKGNIDNLIEPLRDAGFEVVDVRLPRRHTWDVRNNKKCREDARILASYSQDGDIVLAHSYGGIRTALAMELVKYSAVFLFRPAMSRRYKFPSPGTHITCIHSRGDIAIFFGGLLFKHKFGWAGRKGFKDPRVNNIRSTGRHGADFEPQNIVKWLNIITNTIARVC